MHVGHEDIDDHQVESGTIEGRDAVDAAVGDRNPETMLIEPGAHGLPDMRIIVHDQNSPHRGLLHYFSPISTGLTCKKLDFVHRESVRHSYFRRKCGGLSALHRVYVCVTTI